MYAFRGIRLGARATAWRSHAAARDDPRRAPCAVGRRLPKRVAGPGPSKGVSGLLGPDADRRRLLLSLRHLVLAPQAPHATHAPREDRALRRPRNRPCGRRYGRGDLETRP